MFYNPKVFELSGVPVIAYPCKGLEQVLSREKPNAIEEHLKTLYAENKFPKNSEYHIAILWDEKKDLISDIWIFTKTESWGSGPLVDVNIFRGTKQETSIGVSAGNGLIMLGKEEEHRRTKTSLEAYLTEPRPKLPDYLSLNKDF